MGVLLTSFASSVSRYPAKVLDAMSWPDVSVTVASCHRYILSCSTCSIKYYTRYKSVLCITAFIDPFSLATPQKGINMLNHFATIYIKYKFVSYRGESDILKF